MPKTVSKNPASHRRLPYDPHSGAVSVLQAITKNLKIFRGDYESLVTQNAPPTEFLEADFSKRIEAAIQAVHTQNPHVPSWDFWNEKYNAWANEQPQAVKGDSSNVPVMGSDVATEFARDVLKQWEQRGECDNAKLSSSQVRHTSKLLPIRPKPDPGALIPHPGHHRTVAPIPPAQGQETFHGMKIYTSAHPMSMEEGKRLGYAKKTVTALRTYTDYCVAEKGLRVPNAEGKVGDHAPTQMWCVRDGCKTKQQQELRKPFARLDFYRKHLRSSHETASKDVAKTSEVD